MGSSIWNFCLGIFMIAISPCSAIILESLYWNASNTKFTPTQGLVLFPQIGDKMDIVCPRVGGSAVEGKAEFYRVYLVTQDKLARCSVDKSDTPLLNCDKPDRDVKFTFKFQEFSPNLWGLEFLKGMDYYITSTSTGSLQGLDNTNGGVCKAKSMKLILRVGQSASDPPSSPKVSPTRYPPKQPRSRDTSETEAKTEPEEGGGDSHGTIVSEVGLFVGLASGGIVVIIIIIAALLVVLWRCHQRHCHPEGRQSTSMSLNTLAGPKRGSGGSSGNNGSEPSDIVFPMRPSENMFCRHYERVSADYGHPLYLVQEMPAQSPTNIYYKV